jgi:hypothetical protein
MNCLIRGIQGGIDVPKSAIPQSSRTRIILFAISVGPYLSQQVGGLVQATAIVIGSIGTGMVVDILAIIDGRALYFRDRAIYFVDGFAFMGADGSITRSMLQHPSRAAQVRQSMQVGGVPARLGSASCEKQREQHYMTIEDELVVRIHREPPVKVYSSA